MKLALMQPYVFPYIGYYQLINAVEKFVFYDDVNYIKQGWINRNNILINNRPHLFTIPLDNPSSFSKINQLKLNQQVYDRWLLKFLRSLEQTYKRAPFFNDAFGLLSHILSITHASNYTISYLTKKSVIDTARYIGIETEFVLSSSVYKNEHLSGRERVIDICKIEGSEHYINPIGGQALYNKEDFASEGIKLNFLQADLLQYKQFSEEFVPALSMIDILMFNSVSQIRTMLTNFKLY